MISDNVFFPVFPDIFPSHGKSLFNSMKKLNDTRMSISEDIRVILCRSANHYFFSSIRRHTRCLSDWSSDVCSSDLDDPHGALKELKTASDLDSADAVTHEALGSTYLKLHDFRAAEPELRRALDLDPQSGESHRDLGIALRNQGKLDAAIGEFRRAVALMPRDPAVHLLLGQALNKSGERNAGSAELRAAQDMSQRERDTAVAKQLTITGTELHRAGHIPEAAAKLGESTRLNPNDAAAQYNYGLALLIQNRLEEAIDRFRTAVRLNPEDASVYYSLGRALLAQG